MKLDFTRGGFGVAGQAQPRADAVPQRESVSGVVVAQLASLAAQVRILNSKVSDLQRSLLVLAQNDKRLESHANQVAAVAQQADAATRQMITMLRAYAKGGGVQPQQFVPRGTPASDDKPVYQTPPAAVIEAEAVQESAGASEISAAEMAFYQGDQDDEGEGD